MAPSIAPWAWLSVGAVAIVILAFGAWWLWWRLPKRQVDGLSLWISDAKDRADVEDNFRKTITQLFAGIVTLFAVIVALGGAAIAYLQLSQQQKASYDLLISNQIAKGFELLGKYEEREISQRVGGIYALEGVMNASKQYYQAVLQALCAFVRVNARDVVGDGTPADIQAALTVIGSRAADYSTYPPDHLDLRGVHIPKANWFKAKLRDAKLINADLSGADLRGAQLENADLTDADLSDAKLSGVNLGGADLSRVNLTRANLGQLPPARLVGTRLIGANLSSANLQGANLTAAYLTGATLKDTDLSGAHLADEGLRPATGLTQEQLDQACGRNVQGLEKLDPPLKLDRPCPQ